LVLHVNYISYAVFYTSLGLKTVHKLRNGKAAGLDGITPELLKTASKPISSVLPKLFAKIWVSGKIPAEWKDALIVSLYKGKESRSNCASYRPISLLSVPGKVFARVILDRLQPLLRKHRRPQQSGFTAGRSTVDAILALRMLSELHREFSKPLYQCGLTLPRLSLAASRCYVNFVAFVDLYRDPFSSRW